MKNNKLIVQYAIVAMFISYSICTRAQFIQQGTKLIAGSLASDGKQGFSVDISADGNLAIVGVPYDGTTGGALIYIRKNGIWTQEGQKLAGSDYKIGRVTGLAQGTSVAISGDGNTIAIGDPNDNDYVGAAYIFVKDNGSWKQQGSKLLGSGISSVAGQGYSLDLSFDGSKLIVGAPLIYVGNASNKGGAFIYKRNGNAWIQQGNKLFSGTTDVRASEGYAVAISGDGNSIVVGAPGRSTVSLDGEVNFYSLVDNVWIYSGGFSGNGNLGAAVSINHDGTVAIVGNPGMSNGMGEVALFTFRGAWEYSTSLLGSNPEGKFNQGESVSISADGTRIVFGGGGNYTFDDFGLGQAWSFSKSGNNWIEDVQKYQGTGALGNAGIGKSIALSADGKTFIAGGANDDDTKGAAWVFAQKASMPVITSFSPSTASNGETVIITGTNLTNTVSVSFGGNPVISITNITATTVKAVVGQCAAGDVVLTTLSGSKATKSGFNCAVTGFQEQLENRIMAYPNPVTTRLFIRLDNKTNLFSTATVYDYTSRKVTQVALPQNLEILELETSDFRPGMHIIHLQGAANEYRLIFIKE